MCPHSTGSFSFAPFPHRISPICLGGTSSLYSLFFALRAKSHTCRSPLERAFMTLAKRWQRDGGSTETHAPSQDQVNMACKVDESCMNQIAQHGIGGKDDTKSLPRSLEMQQISLSSKVLSLEKKKCSPSRQSCAFQDRRVSEHDNFACDCNKQPPPGRGQTRYPNS